MSVTSLLSSFCVYHLYCTHLRDREREGGREGGERERGRERGEGGGREREREGGRERERGRMRERGRGPIVPTHPCTAYNHSELSHQQLPPCVSGTDKILLIAL